MMQQFLGDYAVWFTVPAVAGTLYFAIQMLFQGLGGDADFDMDMDVSGEINTDVSHHTAGHDFKVLSLQTLSAFFMGGGWMGLAAYRLLELSPLVSSLIAVGAGFGVGWMLVALLRATLKLQNSGNIELSDAVGLVGVVYVSIPEAGAGGGRVKLVIQERSREYNAVQTGDEPIPTGTRVRVASTNPGSNRLIVERA